MATNGNGGSGMIRDFSASVVVFLVALPLCLGVAVASGAPPFSGLIAGIVGGIVVGLLSGSHTSVSGPAAGLTAVVLAQIAMLGFPTFTVAVVLAGLIQIVAGVCRAGFISLFFPTSVIKGLLAAIGIIIILKQIPHLLGRDADPEGDENFFQPDKENTLTEIWLSLTDPHYGALVIGLTCLAILIVWDKIKLLKKSPVPSALIVVLVGIGLGLYFSELSNDWKLIDDTRIQEIEKLKPTDEGPTKDLKKFNQYVKVPTFSTVGEFLEKLQWPDFNGLGLMAVWVAAFTIAAVASLETLLNVEAVDKIDPKKRITPSNRELIAQGVGNTVSGCLAGLPVTSVIVRSSANINAGAQTKLSTILHGVFLLLAVALLPYWLNKIPLACLAAILVMTGWKLASWKIIKSVYKQGWPMFLPFIVTVVAIVGSDLLKGTLIGLVASTAFILRSNLKKPLRRVLEKHVAGDVLHIQLPNQVSFLNRAMLTTTLEEIAPGGHVLLDARDTDYIDPDILDLIRTFQAEEAPVRGITVSTLGFHEHYEMEDRILFEDYTSRELRDTLTPDRVLTILKEGHSRFLKGEQLTRNLHRQLAATAAGQAPVAAVLSCIDSRTPVEIIFDLGLGDIFTARIAGNIARDKVLGSLEFACAVAGAKLILVLGHTRCGAVNAAIDFVAKNTTALAATGCDHLDTITSPIADSVDRARLDGYANWDMAKKENYSNEVTAINVKNSISFILANSRKLKELSDNGTIRIVGAVYDISTGAIAFDI